MYDSAHYQIASQLLIRGLGLIYLIAFFPFLFQIKSLIGSRGILPVEEYLIFVKSRLGARSYYKIPTIFWINCSDTALKAVVCLGTLLSVGLLCGYYPMILIPILYVLYLSIIHVGQDFLSFGWEMFLMELTINTLFLSMTSIPNPFIWISINLVLLRFHFQGGIVKILSRDPAWRDLTAVHYHYQSQPIANTTAWYIHKLPMLFHKFSCLLMFIIELVLPFGIFGGEEIRLAVYIGFVGLQLAIWFTGNFSYLNYLTVIFSTILLSDTYLNPLFGSWIPITHQESPLALSLLVSVAGISLFTLQLMSLWNHFIRIPLFEIILNPLRALCIVNRYGIFAVMTQKRYEIVIEGSDDSVHWEEYLFRHKASELNRRPRRVSPYQPRLDWQVWFLPFSSFNNEIWFQKFLTRLLKGEKEVLKLLRTNPFPDHPPKYIRVKMYDYTFTTFAEKQATGNWWHREYIGLYSPVLSLRG